MRSVVLRGPKKAINFQPWEWLSRSLIGIARLWPGIVNTLLHSRNACSGSLCWGGIIHIFPAISDLWTIRRLNGVRLLGLVEIKLRVSGEEAWGIIGRRRNELPVQRNFSIFNMSNCVQFSSLSGGIMQKLRRGSDHRHRWRRAYISRILDIIPSS